MIELAPVARTSHPLARYGGGWSAGLHASVEQAGGRSVLAGLEHHGPLRIQKALWPEGPSPVHLILLHPPGGIAEGDTLSVDFQVGRGAAALVTTPGAGRWYRAGVQCSMDVRLRVGEDAALEWLPQETIVHDGAHGSSELDVDVDAGGRALGCEVTVLGRRESGERFQRGVLRQTVRVHRDGRLILDDTAMIDALRIGSRSVMGPHHVSGMLWVVARDAIGEDDAGRVEEAMLAAGPALAGASRVDPHLLLARAVDSSTQHVQRVMRAAWASIRPQLLGLEARTPRIWMT